MAAWLESPDHLIVDLRNISPADMTALLDEETEVWRAALDWDFEPSAELVRRFVGMQALSGFALLEGERTIGYSYYIREEKKGLIGDLYVCQRERTAERENALIEATLEALSRTRSASACVTTSIDTEFCRPCRRVRSSGRAEASAPPTRDP